MKFLVNFSLRHYINIPIKYTLLVRGTKSHQFSLLWLGLKIENWMVFFRLNDYYTTLLTNLISRTKVSTFYVPPSHGTKTLMLRRYFRRVFYTYNELQKK